MLTKKRPSSNFSVKIFVLVMVLVSFVGYACVVVIYTILQ
jgi:hypothetical protein